MVTVLPLTVATEGVRLVKLTGRPELAVALMVDGASPKLCGGIAPKVIVCGARSTRNAPVAFVTV